MGYITKYEVSSTGFKDEDEQEYVEFKLYKSGEHWGKGWDWIGDALRYQTEGKWYSWEKDLCTFSKLFPNVTFEVDGIGEDTCDMWKARIRNGESEVVEAEFHFPDFKKIL